MTEYCHCWEVVPDPDGRAVLGTPYHGKYPSLVESAHDRTIEIVFWEVSDD